MRFSAAPTKMKMEFIYMKQPMKMPAYEKILQKAGVSDSAVAYIGDDLPDIPLMHRSDLAIAVGLCAPRSKRGCALRSREPSPATTRSAKPLNWFSNPRASGKR